MKKLGKSTLEELAKRMPVLSEKEQRSSIGGERYHDESGFFIGQIGTSSEIRFVFRSTYYSEILNGSSGNLIQNSAFFSNGTSVQKEGAVRQIASNLGIEIQFMYEDDIRFNGRCKNGSCYINMNSARVNGGNFYDIGLIAIHEKHHLDTPHDTGSFNSEAEAYKTMMDHSYFDYASPSYQNHIVDRYNYYKNL